MCARKTESTTPEVRLHWDGRREGAPQVEPASLILSQRFLSKIDSTENALYLGDNLAILAALRESGERFDLIYADPPYDSGVTWSRRVRLRGTGSGRSSNRAVLARVPEYGDSFGSGDYLQFVQDRLYLLRDLIASTGTLWLHCDHRHAHHLRLLMDEVLGAENWLNTIAWRSQTARGAKANARFFPFSAQSIHIYARDVNARQRWNAPKRRNTLSEAEAAAIFMRDERGFFRTSDPGDYTFESLVRLHGEGRLYAPYGGMIVIDESHRRIYASHGGNIGVKYYLGDLGGGKYLVERTVDNLWEDIPGLGTTPGEDTGYPTQKTTALLERIIATATDAGDRVLDPFSGSGTTAVTAQRLGRRWAAIDVSPRSIQVTTQRLYEVAADPDTPEEAKSGFATYHTSESKSAANASVKEPLPRAEMLITRNAFDAARMQIDVTGWQSPRLAALLTEAGIEGPIDWRALVDAIEIDVDYRADRPFTVAFADAPVRRNRTVSGTYEVLLPRTDATVAVRITDIMGEQATSLIEPAE